MNAQQQSAAMRSASERPSTASSGRNRQKSSEATPTIKTMTTAEGESGMDDKSDSNCNGSYCGRSIQANGRACNLY